MATLLTAAQRYAQAGLAVIPCDRRSKRPRLAQWKPYQTRPPTPVELARWFAPGSYADALAIVAGPVSGGLLVLDFDAPALFAPWAAALQRQAPGLAATLPVVQTQSGGYHVYLRLTGEISGNQKLAVDPARLDGKPTLIETRGAGGYALAPPSAGYTLLQGDLAALPVLTGAAGALLLDTARQFSQEAPTSHAPPTATLPRLPGAGTRPGDDFNRRGAVTTLLARHGWRCVRQHETESYWRRPGKQLGHSATYNYRNTRAFYVFTSNAPPFAPGRAYSPFAVFTLLEYGGDYCAAARALRQQGYGIPGASRR